MRSSNMSREKVLELEKDLSDAISDLRYAEQDTMELSGKKYKEMGDKICSFRRELLKLCSELD